MSNVLGVICEYNPFHNGHLYHLNEAKKLTNSDYSVAVISGNFSQRGDPAIVSKWVKTEMALKCGVDLVLELLYIQFLVLKILHMVQQKFLIHLTLLIICVLEVNVEIFLF